VGRTLLVKHTTPARVASSLALSSTLVAALLFMTAGGASADPTSSSQLGQIGGQLQGAEEKAAQIAAQIQSDSDHLDVLDQQYEAAQQQVQALDQSMIEIGTKVAATQATVNTVEAQLRQEALLTYTGGSTDQAVAELFSPAGERQSITARYRQIASSDVTQTIDRLHVAQHTQSQQEAQMQTAEGQARSSEAQIASAQAQAKAVLDSEQSELSQAKGQVASLLSQREAVQQAADAASFATKVGSSGAGLANLPVAPGSAGAVQAAESQLGVPYQWGGEDPGVGFDCSGLTQWAWARAGVSIPRTAEEQYDAIPHVALSSLEPGDLLFWNDGTSSVQHVAMYVGNGDVIQAPHTGTTVSYSPIWGDGLVGAGRP
jgi:cell wall-associated NlpC family hydrolase